MTRRLLCQCHNQIAITCPNYGNRLQSISTYWDYPTEPLGEAVDIVQTADYYVRSLPINTSYKADNQV